MTPIQKKALMHGLKMLAEFIESAPIEKSCSTCLYYKEKTCRFYEMVPPQHIIEAGCESYSFDMDAAPF